MRCRMRNPKKKSYFYCLKHLGINHLGDGIQRGNQRQKGHIKDLYCPQCREIVKCLEIRHCDWFEEIKERAEKLHIEFYEKVG